MSEALERARVVEVARSWIGTPYHPCAQKKRVGVDCGNLPAAVYAEAGLIDPVKIPNYSPQWMLHQRPEMFMNLVLAVGGREFDGPPLPGDFVMFQFGRCFSHGGIVVSWPTIIHAQVKACVMPDDVSKCRWLDFIGEGGPEQGKRRPRKFFTLWGA